MKGMPVCVLMILAMAQLMVEPAQAFTCAEITPSMIGCVSFFTGADSKPTTACCDGVKKVRGFCVSTDDKRLTCNCMKQAASAIHEIKDSAVFSLPTACNQPLPFPISNTIDCNTIA